MGPQKAEAPPDSQACQQRLLQLKKEVARRGMHTTLSTPSHRGWSLSIRYRRLSLRRQIIQCAGAEGVYVFFTASGHILGPAEAATLPAIADLIARRTRRPRLP